MSKEAETYDAVVEAWSRLTISIMPKFANVMQKAYGDGWIGHATRVEGPSGLSPALCPGQTIIDSWNHFAPFFPQKDLTQIKKAVASLIDVRIEIAKPEAGIDPEVGLRLLKAIQQVAIAFDALALSNRIGELIAKQRTLVSGPLQAG